jgi:hypothetical protein
MKRKKLKIIIALVLALSLSTLSFTAFAEDIEEDTPNQGAELVLLSLPTLKVNAATISWTSGSSHSYSRLVVTHNGAALVNSPFNGTTSGSIGRPAQGGGYHGVLQLSTDGLTYTACGLEASW